MRAAEGPKSRHPAAVDWCVSGAREKLTATEAKLKAAVAERTNAQIEKAALERELKGMRGQAGRLTKVSALHAALSGERAVLHGLAMV